MSDFEKWIASKPSEEELINMLRRYEKHMIASDKLMDYLTNGVHNIPDELWIHYEGSHLDVCMEITRSKRECE